MIRRIYEWFKTQYMIAKVMSDDYLEKRKKKQDICRVCGYKTVNQDKRYCEYCGKDGGI